jgi:hypothetical protein
MPKSHRSFAAAFVVLAFLAAAVALIVDGKNPVAAFIADMAGSDGTDAHDAGPARAGSPATASTADGAPWDGDEADDPDAAAWLDPGVRPLRVRVLDPNQAPVGGVPVFVLGSGTSGPVLAGPKTTNAEGRVRFPIDLAMEQEHDVVVAARAVPGRAATVAAKVAIDRESDVTLALDAGIRASIQVLDPEGRPVNAVARVRKAILDDGSVETGPRAELLAQVFSETTPRAIRTPAGFELVGLRTPDDVTLVVSAAGFAPLYRPVHVPPQASSPFPIEVKLETRTSVVRLEAAIPAGVDKDQAAFSCHRVEGSGVIVAAGSDEVPAQRSPRFAFEVAPNEVQRLQVFAWIDGRIQAAGDVDVPALREGEVLDVGQVRMELLPVVLAGRVVDQDQGPLANATVEAIGVGRFRDLAATTGPDGGFALRAPSGRGPYQVSAHASGRVSEKIVGVVDPALDLRFVLEPSGAIQGSIVPASAAQAERVSVRAVTSGRTPFATTPQPDGSFTLGGLPRGVYTVFVEGGGIQPIRVSDVVVNPPDVTRDGRLERLRLRGLVAGQP